MMLMRRQCKVCDGLNEGMPNNLLHMCVCVYACKCVFVLLHMFEENNEIMTHIKWFVCVALHDACVRPRKSECVWMCVCAEKFIPSVLIYAEGRTQGEKPEGTHLDKLTLLEQDVSVEMVAQRRSR